MAKLVGVDGPTLYLNLLKPKIKVGNEFVTQGRNKDQVGDARVRLMMIIGVLGCTNCIPSGKQWFYMGSTDLILH